MEGVDLGQEADIVGGVAAGKRPGGWAAAVTDATGIAELGNQPGRLRPGQAGDLAEIAPYQPLVGLAEAKVGEAAQLGADPLVSGLPGRSLEAEGLSAFQEGADFLQGLESLGL